MVHQFLEERNHDRRQTVDGTIHRLYCSDSRYFVSIEGRPGLLYLPLYSEEHGLITNYIFFAPKLKFQ